MERRKPLAALDGNMSNLDLMAKKIKSKPSPKKLNLKDDPTVHLDMSFEEAIKKAVNTPIKKSKIKK